MWDLRSIFMFEILHDLHLKVFRLLKSSFIQNFLYGDVFSRPLTLAEKRRKLSSLKISSLKARKEVPVHVVQQYALPGLHLNAAKKHKTAQLNGSLTGEGF